MSLGIRTSILFAALGMTGAPLAWSLPSGALSAPSRPTSRSSGPAPSAAAVTVYNKGVATMKRADALNAKAAAESGAARGRTERSARSAYGKAHAEFLEATRKDPGLPQAWNNLGYTARQTGHYEDALAAYARALALKPNYPQALEYRGVAYLHMYRLQQARQAYMDLFVNDRAVAKDFLGVMKRWVAAERGRSGPHAAAVASLAKWVAARSRISAQTASLTRAGTAASWR